LREITGTKQQFFVKTKITESLTYKTTNMSTKRSGDDDGNGHDGNGVGETKKAKCVSNCFITNFSSTVPMSMAFFMIFNDFFLI
jgi:alpha-tubulin suppressor-like RCC1 family protein